LLEQAVELRMQKKKVPSWANNPMSMRSCIFSSLRALLGVATCSISLLPKANPEIITGKGIRNQRSGQSHFRLGALTNSSIPCINGKSNT
jgi:hypothetical protein